MTYDEDTRELVDLLRQDRLDHCLQMARELAERERANPGSVPDLAAESLHQSMRSWASLLELDVRA